ncbi:hypothetical protein BGW36DRAFT_426621 [Talaromyces proteolyticus]|uniref:Uncharacterized protein n=1 Tax=Talaromyces proteolyticus TaxID=1131652 RepID=A0AAD4Q1P7_9EURO|nr:uncharacterized protein BGW36DRAFT_426621 [Talaromyces proteolyticus]KAH8698939.1 hypothetical protein BGW36DRAFT_426621 [Talaromyces proteolyticus]
MCGDIPSRASKGGLIAVIRPYEELSRNNNMGEFRILFNNNSDGSNHTQATFDASDEATLKTLQNHPFLSLQIEKSGDLSTPLPSEPLHSFKLNAAQQTSMEFELPSKLDLGVSNLGIVGRLVTVLSAGSSNGMGHVLGRGVVGWN